jgi:hypothetical protein
LRPRRQTLSHRDFIAPRGRQLKNPGTAFVCDPGIFIFNTLKAGN